MGPWPGKERPKDRRRQDGTATSQAWSLPREIAWTAFTICIIIAFISSDVLPSLVVTSPSMQYRTLSTPASVPLIRATASALRRVQARRLPSDAAGLQRHRMAVVNANLRTGNHAKKGADFS